MWRITKQFTVPFLLCHCGVDSGWWDGVPTLWENLGKPFAIFVCHMLLTTVEWFQSIGWGDEEMHWLLVVLIFVF